MNSNASAFLVGRTLCQYPCSYNQVEDHLFAAQRLDGIEIDSKIFRHCTFSNISFKDVRFNNVEFTDCVFIGCYFRKAIIKTCRFQGSKFISCQFPKVSIKACDFIYAQFEDGIVFFDEMELNLPPEHNLRQELSANLAHAAETLGLTKEASKYQMNAIKAHEDHLWAAVRSKTTWYKEHYSASSRTGAFVEFLGSKMNGLVWGYGERWWTLLRNFIFLTFGIFPFFLWLSRSGLISKTDINFGSLEWLSVSTILSFDGISNIMASSNWARGIMIGEVLCGLIIAGLFITLLFRTIVQR